MGVYIKVKLATFVEGDPKAPFSIATTPKCKRWCYSIPWIAPLDPYLKMMSLKQGGIKYHFLSLWYGSTWGWTPSRGSVANALTNRPIYIYCNSVGCHYFTFWVCSEPYSILFGEYVIYFHTWFTKFNERTKHLFIKNISHFILERGT